MTMSSQISDMISLSNFLVKCSYWSKFHVNFTTGSEIMTIFFYKGLARNPEIGNTPVSVLPNIWRLGQVRGTKFGTNVSNKMLLNDAKCKGYSFYRFWVITPPRTHPPPRLGLIQDLINSPSVGNKKFIELVRMVSWWLFNPI